MIAITAPSTATALGRSQRPARVVQQRKRARVSIRSAALPVTVTPQLVAQLSEADVGDVDAPIWVVVAYAVTSCTAHMCCCVQAPACIVATQLHVVAAL